jgi:hypothetical protein
MSAAWSKIHEDLSTSEFYQRVKQRPAIWQRLQKGGMFLAVTVFAASSGACTGTWRSAHTALQVPVSSLNSAAADLETHVMRQSPRISNQLVTLNSRTFDVSDSTLTPAMVRRSYVMSSQRAATLITRAGLRIFRTNWHFV